MPYPNEHSCRLVDPKEFKEYARENDEFGDGIHAIYGIQTKPERKSVLQAIRFDSEKFTVAKAKKWAKDHSHKCILFEPANGESAYFPMSGFVGDGINPEDLRYFLLTSEGKDVEIQISSPGGFIFPGLEIFNLIRNYEGFVTIRIVGLAASMASYIAMAGDRIIAEDNAVFMIHNASGFASGDYKILYKTGKVLEGLTNLLAQKYALKTKKSIEDIRKMMDEETYLYGSEIYDASFVDEIAVTEHEKDKDAALSFAAASFEECRVKIKAGLEMDDLEKAAALLDTSSLIRNQGGDDKENSGAWEFCVCDSCNYWEKHSASAPCGKCPKCGTQMHGSNEKPKEENIMKSLKEIMGIKDAKKRKEALEDYLKSDLSEDQKSEVLQMLIDESKAEEKIASNFEAQISSLQTEIADMKKQRDTDQKLLEEERDARHLLEVETALEKDQVIGDVKKMAKIIHSLEKISPELAKEMRDQVMESTNRLRAAGLFLESGSTTEANISTAYSKLQKKVDDLLKSPEFSNVSPAKVWKKVISENPELYKEYLQTR